MAELGPQAQDLSYGSSRGVRKAAVMSCQSSAGGGAVSKCTPELVGRSQFLRAAGLTPPS